MEEGLRDSERDDSPDLFEYIRKELDMSEKPPGEYSPLALAYIGDGIYELIVRTILLAAGNRPQGKLHREAVKYVSAPAQARIIGIVAKLLDEEELAIYKRGRNAKPHSMAKNAHPGDYHAATGFEALMGYLYMSGRIERLLYLVRRGMEELNK